MIDLSSKIHLKYFGTIDSNGLTKRKYEIFTVIISNRSNTSKSGN
jgi:hypothetical protein